MTFSNKYEECRLVIKIIFSGENIRRALLLLGKYFQKRKWVRKIRSVTMFVINRPYFSSVVSRKNLILNISSVTLLLGKYFQERKWVVDIMNVAFLLGMIQRGINWLINIRL